MDRPEADIPLAESVLAALGDLVLVVGVEDRRLIDCGAAGVARLGHDREGLTGTRIDELLHPDDAWLTKRDLADLAAGADVAIAARLATADDGWIGYRFKVTNLDADTVVASGRQFDERTGQTAVNDERRQLELLKTLSDITDDVFVVTDERGFVQYTNNAAERIHGQHDFIGRHITDFVHADDTGFAALMSAPRKPNSRVDGRVLARTADGSSVMLSVSTVFDGESRRWFTVERDISGLIEQEAEMGRLNEDLHRRATTDALTGVANRAALNDWLELAETSQGTYALLLLDMDDFKSVNDTFGHAAGDDLLSQVAARLVASTRPGDLVARLGGDEFVIVIAEASDGQAAVVANRVVDAVSKPYDIDGHSLARSCSVGVAIHGPEDTPSTVLRRADRAAYEAKHVGRSRYVVFDAQ